MAGTVTNNGDQVVRDVSVRLRLSATPLISRAELAAAMAGQVPSRDGDVLVEATLIDLAPGGSTSFTLNQALSEVASLTGFGVHVLGVEVIGTRGSTTGRVSITRTLLPWVPAPSDISPTGFSWVWPLVDTPVRQADGRFADDSLAADLAIGGRLDRLVEAGARLGDGAAVTWAIDPDLIETVADMADENGYLVATRGDGSVPGGGGALAQQWLDRLRAATAGADVLALPYADPDVAALVHNGQPQHLAQSRSIGAEALSALLPSASVIADIAWPVDGYLDRDTLDSLGRAGVSAAILDGRALPTTVDLPYTPSGRAQLRSSSGRVAALLADPSLVDLLARSRASAARRCCPRSGSSPRPR